jgi:hypothetical protein
MEINTEINEQVSISLDFTTFFFFKISVLSRVRGSVTNNNGFWVG